MGDFNGLIRVEDKIGGNPHPEYLFHGFCEVVTDCQLVDLLLHGYQFT